jgi:GAF domain-containing protein
VNSPATDHFGDTVAEITALLVTRHDGLTVSRAVVDASLGAPGAEAAGILVRDPGGGFELLCASDERSRFTELMQALVREGPCLDSIDENALISSSDLATESRWPKFTVAAMDQGIRAVHAFPLRLADHAIGGLNLFHSAPATLSSRQRHQAQALADLAVLGLTQERDQRRVERLAEITLRTMNDRARIGQAVGIVAATLAITPEAARSALAAYSARTGRTPTALAADITDGTIAAETLRDED